ncbi:LysE/ArgO family amino acid transporter [Alteribacter populi]|uniref:LysE/ArgO family amino acid transporter n=1 Tax=Alteribacter populi TaxID=2011011 RepID=UPI000BBAD2EB|nr:LysE/ArgO family amino acid transporter [Alteribacter populi]
MEAFIHGLALAFGIILPMGVQNLFIFNQGINQPSYFKALPAIITASVCDTVLIVVAVFLMSLMSELFESIKITLIIGGFFFLSYMGWVIWNTSCEDANKEPPASAKKQVFFALSVSLLNPHALLDTVGVIGTNSLLYTNIDKWFFMIAAIIVSWTYFFFIAFIGKIIGQKDKKYKFRIIFNKISALTIWFLAFYMLFML